MHHSLKPDEVKAERDKFFAEYWTRELEGCDDPTTPLVNVCHEVAEHAFAKGFFHGLVVGSKHGALLAGAAISEDIQDILDAG